MTLSADASSSGGYPRAIPGLDAARLRNARVLVVGAGALGNEVLKNLALLDVRNICLLDFDRIEPHNLSRSVLFRPEDCTPPQPKADVAARRLLEINPDLRLLTLKGDVMTDLGLGLLRSMDLVFGCVDNRLARLWLNRLCWRAGVPWINGGILNLAGQVNVYAPGHGCYECELTPTGWRDIRQRLGCTDMAQRYAASGQMPTTPLAASVIGAVQVQEGLKILLDEPDALAGRMFSYEGAHLHSAVYTPQPLKEECGSHFELPEVVVASELGGKTTVEAALGQLRDLLGVAEVAMVPAHELVTAVAGMTSKVRHAVMLPRMRLSERVADVYREVQGEAVAIPRDALLRKIDRDFPAPERTLGELGFPCWDVIQVRTEKGRFWVEMGADRKDCEFVTGIHEIENPWFEFVPKK
ncbi:MAG: ThiF family adenylyltransferase [Bacteroidota bacterium]